ncbi:DNA-directed RNA polymerase subunit delta [Neobacillus niacini]|uniref:DNA-directed RNA polymerase subunit delta n=1 Tax=Neobacillus niacini TaxID=86668 RepID=UPI0021CB8ECC|nr:DNA-directed RNA polymerase subunit delta [Neobacillus niacini]MCM3764060.1 DNA-directed RNA polymerase subunit delta [Neobacillus niacini]
MSLAQYSKEELQQLSLIEMAYEYMKNSKQPISFSELVSEITAAAGLSEKEMRARLAQFYTDLNVDGRFLSLGENRWGLRVWYPVDTQEEEVVTAVKPKKKKLKKVVDEDEIEDFDEIEEEEFDDIDDFDDEDDLLDDEEEVFDEIDEVDEFEDEEVLEDDEEFELDEEEELDEELEVEEELELEEDEDEDL